MTGYIIFNEAEEKELTKEDALKVIKEPCASFLFGDLSVYDKIDLYFAYYVCRYVRMKDAGCSAFFGSDYFNKLKVSDFRNEDVFRCLQQRGLVCCEKDSADEFIWNISQNNKYLAFAFDEKNTTFFLNVTFRGADELCSFTNGLCLRKISREEAMSVYVKYALADIEYQFEEMLEERGLYLDITQEGAVMLRDLILKIPYTQIINLCYAVAKYYSDKVITGRMYRRQVSQIALKSIFKFYKKRVENGWELYHSDTRNVGVGLWFLITHIFQRDIEVLACPPGLLISKLMDEAE